MKFTRRTILKALAAALLAPGLPYTRLLVSEGNSLTSPEPDFKKWPDQLATEPYMAGFRIINSAVAGSTTDGMNVRGPTVDSYIGQANESWLTALEVTNTLGGQVGVAETFRRHVEYCKDRKRAGYKVLIGTGMSRNNMPYFHFGNGFTWNELQELNQKIRDTYTQYADGLLDFAAVPELGSEQAWSNPIYFRDNVHPTDEGSRLMKNVVLAVLQRMISAPLYIPFFAAAKH